MDHSILLSKLYHYGIRGITNDWFKSYLTNRQQYVTINDHSSELLDMKYGVPQGSVLGPLLFLIYINDLHKAIKYSTVRHFADDTNLLIKSRSPKQLQKHLNLDLKNLTNWLKANKISLNTSKSELIIFRHPNKKINYDFKIKIDGKKLIPTEFVKYLGIFIDQHLSWSYQVNTMSTKLSRGIGMLSKIRHYVSKDTLCAIYYAIFNSILVYGSHVWGQNFNRHIQRLEKLQNKAIRIINFANFRDSVSKLYKTSRILKLRDMITVQNFLFVHDELKGHLPIALSNKHHLACTSHRYNTRGASRKQVTLPKVNTMVYGIKSLNFQSSITWNNFMDRFHEHNLLQKSKSVSKKTITNYFFNSY